VELRNLRRCTRRHEKWLAACTIGITIFSLSRADESASKHDGNYLLKQCNEVVRFLDSNGERGDHEASGWCLGYVNGFLLGHNAAILSNQSNNPKSNAARMFCTEQRNVTPGQLARVLVKFLTEHPNSLDLTPDILTLEAFKEAFPCR
jgi:Rap1a immunity proteins